MQYSFVSSFGLILFFALLSSCKTDDTCGNISPSKTYQTTNIELKQIEYTIDSTMFFFNSTDLEKDSVAFVNWGLEIVEENIQLSQKSVPFNFFPTAMACSPVPDRYDQISSINITSDQDLGTNFQAGSELSKLFQIIQKNEEEFDYYNVHQLPLLYNLQAKGENTLIFKNTTIPPGTYSFTIQINLNSSLITSKTFQVGPITFI